MVWVKLVPFIFFLINTLNASELTQEEKNFFKFIDFNNDGFISVDEINKSTNIIFQLIDINKDDKISLIELEDLKEIIDLIK